MNSKILQAAVVYLKIIFLVAALMSLIRGHNQPGGGFIGGLLASLAVIYPSFALNVKDVKKGLRIQPERHIAIGLALAVLSILPGLILNHSWMKGVWISFQVLNTDIKLGTPLLFDIGVFFTVLGVSVLFFFTLTNKK